MKKLKIKSKTLCIIAISIIVAIIVIVKIGNYIINDFIPAQNAATTRLVDAEKTLNAYQEVQSTFLNAHKGTKYVGLRTQIYIEIMNTISPENTSINSDISKEVIKAVNKLSDADFNNNAPQDSNPLLLDPIIEKNSTGNIRIPIKINGEIKDIYIKLAS